MKPKAPWSLIIGMCLVAAVMVAISLAQERSERQAAERAAMEASYGETPKPVGHGVQ